MPLLPHPFFKGSPALLPLYMFTLAACDNPLALSPPSFENVMDTVVMYAVQGTPIGLPSAFDVTLDTLIRTDRGEAFDFLFDIDAEGTAKIFPSGALGLSSEPGVILATDSFEAVTDPPEDGYTRDSALAVTEGAVFIVQSRTSSLTCDVSLGALPRYAKFHVRDIDHRDRLVRLEVLVNLNCGYRSLQPGFPDE